MRVRPLAAIVAVLGAAAAATTVVVTQLPREGDVSPGRAPAPAPAAETPALEPAATAGDGVMEVRVTSGGEPISGAQVDLYARLPEQEPGAEPAWRRAGAGRTDARAVAHIPARPGTYLATARAPGLAGRAEVFRAAGEDVSRAEVAIAPPVQLRGRVAAAHGAPAARALVRATPIASRWPSFSPASAPAEEIATAETGPDGAFRLDGLAPGSYALSVEASGHHPALLPRVEAPAEALAVSLEPLGTAAGVVLLDGGRPASGAKVRAASAEHGASAVAGADGRFTIAAPAGCYRIDAVLGDRAGAARAPVTLAPGAAARPVEIRLGPAASVQGEVVLAARRTPVAGAEVALLAHETREISARARTGPDGRFSLGGLAPGAYDLRALAPGTTPVLVPAVTLAAGSRFSLAVALPGTGAIEGVVRHPSGRPLAGIDVRVVSRGDGLAGVAPLSTRSAFDGAFRFDAVEAGRAEVVAQAEGVLTGASRTVRVAEGRSSRADVFLAEAGFLAGRVAPQGGGRPPLGTTVVAVALRSGLGARQVARIAADASGNYRLALPGGEYRVHAAPGDVDRTDLRVAPSFARIEPGRTAALDLSIAAPAAEEGTSVRVLEPGGAPSAGAVVTVSRAGEGRVALATSAGDDGRVVLAPDMGMAGRAVTIRARNGGRSGQATLELPRAGTVAVTLSPGGSVEGRVRTRGRPPSGFSLEVASQPSAEGWRTVDVHRFAGDRFEVADLPAEPLRLTVRTDDGRRGEAEVRVAGGETRAVTIALDR